MQVLRIKRGTNEVGHSAFIEANGAVRCGSGSLGIAPPLHLLAVAASVAALIQTGFTPKPMNAVFGPATAAGYGWNAAAAEAATVAIPISISPWPALHTVTLHRQRQQQHHTSDGSDMNDGDMGAEDAPLLLPRRSSFGRVATLTTAAAAAPLQAFFVPPHRFLWPQSHS
jgi:hypothetical protein